MAPPVPLTPLFTTDMATYVGLPPRPPLSTQQIVDGAGRPTFEFNLFLTQQYEWQRRLLSMLDGVKYPARQVGDP
jgi:hypothetical protein